MTSKTNRRAWIKSGLMTAGGLALAPQLIFASKGRIPQQTGSVLKDITTPSMLRAPGLKARLNLNENPFGPSQAVQQAIIRSVSTGNRYGHDDADKLIELLAQKEGVPADHVILGPGSTDLLEKSAIAGYLKGGNIVSADPSYMSIVNTAQAIGATWKPVPLTADYAHDLPTMMAAIDAQTHLIYVCNPNNPMGSITPAKDLYAFCRDASAKVPVFVDEAYLDFLDKPEENSMVGLVREGHDVMIARTFSKIHGMAGLRIGYLVARPERIKTITSIVRSDMGLCVTTLSGALAGITDHEFCMDCRKQIVDNRNYLVDELKKLNYPYVPSYTNFVIFPIRSNDGKAFQAKLQDEGVGVRMFTINDKPYCRVSMGTRPEMELFTAALKKAEA